MSFLWWMRIEDFEMKNQLVVLISIVCTWWEDTRVHSYIRALGTMSHFLCRWPHTIVQVFHFNRSEYKDNPDRCFAIWRQVLHSQMLSSQLGVTISAAFSKAICFHLTFVTSLRRRWHFQKSCFLIKFGNISPLDQMRSPAHFKSTLIAFDSIRLMEWNNIL